jgi:hypothetical protein
VKIRAVTSNRTEMKIKETGIRLKGHPPQKTAREKGATMNKGETALVQMKERKNPHFAQFKAKAH